jgi:ATP:ADP antiporter, AAA family
MSVARPGAGTTRPAIVAAALLLGQQVAARATRDALFLSSFDVSALPTMTAAAAAVSLVATFAFSRAMSRLAPARVLPAALAASAAAFVGEWGLALAFPGAAAVAVYLHQAVLGAVVVSGFWSLITERLDPHAAKHAMGPIGAGASLGGVVGGLVTWGAAARVGPPTMLIALAGISLLGLVSVRVLAPAGAGRSSGAAPSEIPLPGRSALRMVRDSPYLAGLAALVGLAAFLDAVLDYLLAAAAAASIPAGAPLMSFFALFHAGAGLLALLTQAALVRPLLQRLGPAGALVVQPVFTAVGAALVLAAPRLASIVALRGGHAVLRNSVFRSGYELLYAPLPEEQKRPTKVIVDVACDRIGTVAGSMAVMAVLLVVPGGGTRLLLALAAIVAVVTVVLTPRFRRGYVGALASSLRAGAASLDPPSIVDPTMLLTLASMHEGAAGLGRYPIDAAVSGGPGGDPVLEDAAALRSGDPARVLRVLAAGELDPRLVSHVIPLLSNDGFFEAVASSLRRSAGRSTGQLVDALLDPQLDGITRRRVARVLKGVPTQRAADGLLQGLDDPRFDLRYRCAQALLRLRGQNPALVIPADRVLASVARAAAQASDSPRHLEHCFTLLGIVLERGPLEIAYRALRGTEAGLRGTALEYLDNVLPGPLRDKLWPHFGAAARLAPSGRSTAEIRDDLLRSTTSVRRPDSSDR